MSVLRFTVHLNGTNANPWHGLRLTQNPFPQIGRYEYTEGVLRVQSLGGEPLTGPDDIRRRLAGFSEEFIEGCIARFRVGEMVVFEAEWPGGEV